MRKLRDVLRLRHAAGLSIRDISHSTKLSVSGIQKLLSRARHSNDNRSRAVPITPYRSWAAAGLWLTAGHVRSMALPVGLTLFIEVLAWFAAIIAALYYAPSFVRPVSIHWAMTNMPFDVLGAPGQYLRKGLKWLDKDH